jgi:type VI secretion system protein ImpL
VTFIVGGTELSYRLGAGAVNNPLTLPALREFRCPTGI